MSTTSATGSSTSPSTSVAAHAAVKAALDQLDGKTARFGLLFVAPKHKLDLVLEIARSLSPETDFLGCTTAGEITERGLTRGGIAAMLVASDEFIHDLQFTTGLKKDFNAAAARLCERFNDSAAAARKRGYIDSTTVTLIDGLTGAGEKLVGAMMKSTRAFHQIVGGAAGDDGRFKGTFVGAGEEASSDSAAALHVFGPTPWGVGVDHGLNPSTPKMMVTRAVANVVYEIDGRPAFEIYKDYAKERGFHLTPENAGPFMMNNELGVYFLNQLQRARAPLSVGADGSLACAAEIAEGSSISILDGKRDDLLAAARNASKEALTALQGAKPAGVLLFDCICRGTILEKDFSREIDAVRSVFPDVPVAGFLTYGEIARYKGRLDGWHNTTAVVVAIPTQPEPL